MEWKTMTHGDADKGASHFLSLTSLFDDRGAAVEAAERLKAAGIPPGSISLIKDVQAPTKKPDDQNSLWDKLENFLFPQADHAAYREGIRRGGHLLAISGLSPDRHDLAFNILDDAGAVDLDQRIETWRSEGWSDSQDFLDELQAPPAIIDGDVAASLIDKGRGEEVVPVITEKLKFGEKTDKSRPRVRVYTVEYALKSPDDEAGSRSH